MESNIMREEFEEQTTSAVFLTTLFPATVMQDRPNHTAVTNTTKIDIDIYYFYDVSLFYLSTSLLRI